MLRVRHGGADAGPVLHAEQSDAPPARWRDPWISDGTPHQWITPLARRRDQLPEGRQRQNVPDMDVCNAEDDGCQTFYYTNQQSARLMFYHDHAWGITRLNVYAGEAAGYVLTDMRRAEPVRDPADRTRPWADGTPLVIQDKTFVPRRRAARAAGPDVGQRPVGVARAACGTTTCTCPLRTPGIRPA